MALQIRLPPCFHTIAGRRGMMMAYSGLGLSQFQSWTKTPTTRRYRAFFVDRRSLDMRSYLKVQLLWCGRILFTLIVIGMGRKSQYPYQMMVFNSTKYDLYWSSTLISAMILHQPTCYPGVTFTKTAYPLRAVLSTTRLLPDAQAQRSYFLRSRSPYRFCKWIFADTDEFMNQRGRLPVTDSAFLHFMWLPYSSSDTELASFTQMPMRNSSLHSQHQETFSSTCQFIIGLVVSASRLSHFSFHFDFLSLLRAMVRCFSSRPTSSSMRTQQVLDSRSESIHPFLEQTAFLASDAYALRLHYGCLL